jgi:hypothetical protein
LVTNGKNKFCALRVNHLPAKTTTSAYGTATLSGILLIENGRCVHRGGPMAKILARIHRIFGA